MLLTRKSAATDAARSRLARGLPGVVAQTIDRRAFLKRSGLGVGAGAIATQLPFNMIGTAEAANVMDTGKVESDGCCQSCREI